MKCTAPPDIEDRLFRVEERVHLLARVLAALGNSFDATGAPDEYTLRALGDVADEVADEVKEIHAVYVDESNADYFRVMALDAKKDTGCTAPG